jgi:signal transduction histidine kinase
VLLDLHMPHIDGFAVLDDLRDRWDEHVPILVVTGDVSTEARDRALRGGAVDFLTKPFDPHEVMLRVRNFLQIRALHLQLREHNRSLERRVHQRTRELEQANRRLTELDRLKDDFTSMVSHEMRTLLTVLLGVTEILLRAWDQIGDEDRRTQLESAKRSAERLERLVGNLLLTSRIEADAQQGPRATRTQEVDVETVLDGLVGGTDGHDKDVVVDCPHGLTLRTDEELLRRILGNFLANARTYGAPPIEVSAKRADTDVVISVRDHGPGVSEEFRPHLFQRFQQGSVGLRRDAKGVGLGLWVASGLARMLGGETSFEPVEPTGACFTVRLPISSPPS